GGVATGSFKTKRNGTATITATMKGSDGSTISESIKITVDKKLPVLDLDGASNMNASQRSLTLTATLDDNDTGTYVGNERIRWEVSHPDHISITSYDSRLSNYKAQVTIRSRYNIEKARVYVYMADNADINHYHTVYVTGLSYLPQTGQDTTILYVVGTLCAAMFLTAGVLYARRKSSQNV
ncbi:MAG: LPXTG cell wall anchor domain-containing protein, partial [Clostridia bacterium]|nr:LPXTG cell wall anchor domain-containing protein [Clostridia bacterium]